MQQAICTKVGLFLIGVTDATSFNWVKNILFYSDPKTHKIMSQSIQLQRTLMRSVLQAGVITTLIPLIARWMGFEIIYWALKTLSLLFTYTYLTFYNMDVTQLTSQIITAKTRRHPQLMPEPDVKQKIDLLWDMGNQIQSLIFELVYYTPMRMLLIIVMLFDQSYFPWLLVLMDSFFNTAFYFFRKWPYDKYNVAFLQKNLSYCIGYGLPVSLIVTIVLPSSMVTGGYLLISQYMIVNALTHSPPQVIFTTPQQVWNALVERDLRRRLKSAYNIHRRKLKGDLEYRRQILEQCVIMRPFFALTDRINRYLREKVLRKDETLPMEDPNESSSLNFSVLEESTISRESTTQLENTDGTSSSIRTSKQQ